MSHHMPFHLGLHCLPSNRLGVSSIKMVKMLKLLMGYNEITYIFVIYLSKGLLLLTLITDSIPMSLKLTLCIHDGFFHLI